MLIGVDFDNTIVRYDRLFHRIARRRGLIPPGVPATKEAVRDCLRRQGQEKVWVELQGLVYGPGMRQAPAFPGALAFLRRCVRMGIRVKIISHRTRRPFSGPAYDLHRWARVWLRRHGFLDPRGLGLKPADIQFKLTKEAKLRAIERSGCTHFIDDLPEFLNHPRFPKGVAKWLFDPQNRAHRGDWQRARSWRQIAKSLLPADGLDADLRRAASSLAEAAGERGVVRVRPIAGAANNRVFRLDAGGRVFLLKDYFHHPQDRRDRLGAEFAFCRNAWNAGLRCLPRPRACDRKGRRGLYDFIEGRRPKPGEVTAAAVRQAAAFYRGLNSRRALASARTLPAASEACFSTAEHLACVRRRLRRLRSMDGASRIERQALEFVRGELLPAWREVELFVSAQSRRLAVPLRWRLPLAQRRLTPSDFGFHNALVGKGGRLAFIDFEYAGWDDPAKTICDFFCQQAVPVPLRHFPIFVRGALSGLKRPGLHRQRVAMLMPVHRLKWCCILLNEFLPAGKARRRFAGFRARREGQLLKARALLRDLWRPLPGGS